MKRSSIRDRIAQLNIGDKIDISLASNDGITVISCFCVGFLGVDESTDSILISEVTSFKINDIIFIDKTS